MTPTDTDGLDRVIHRLHQSARWAYRDDDGRLHCARLNEMTPEHRRNVLRWLRDRATQLHAQQIDYHHREIRRGRDYAEIVADIGTLKRTPPGAWLDETPLVRRLAELVPRQPAPPRGLLRRWFR